jgi:Flp pilus assembly protein TadD
MSTRWTPAPGRHAIVWLAMALLPAFGVTALVARAHHVGQRRLAAEWSARGESALAHRQPDAAVDAFRTALTFSHEDRALRLRLARALIAAGRGAEARAHLVTLWEDQPGNGPVNLELGRLAAADRDVPTALRHYHNAVEGAWPADAEASRRRSRLELATFLVSEQAFPQAQSELIALAAELPEDPADRMAIAGMMLVAGLAERALPIYQGLARELPRDAAPALGAGRAAFALRNDSLAGRFLSDAVSRGATEPDVATMLQVVRLENTVDPFARRLSRGQRAARTQLALAAARARLACLAEDPSAEPLRSQLTGLQAAFQARSTGEQETTDDAMDLVLQVERVTAAKCGPPEPIDLALRRVAERREGVGG